MSSSHPALVHKHDAAFVIFFFNLGLVLGFTQNLDGIASLQTPFTSNLAMPCVLTSNSMITATSRPTEQLGLGGNAASPTLHRCQLQHHVKASSRRSKTISNPDVYHLQ